MENSIKLFNDNKIRVEWKSEAEKWWFSIVDIIAVLTDNDFQGARNYWKVLKHRLNAEGNQTVTNCNQLKMLASDGKMRLTDVADTEQLLRLIQSIPYKKAEPFKMWLAKVGKERIDEIENPELSQDEKPETFDKSKDVAKRGGKVVGNAKIYAEKELGRPVTTRQNYLSITDKKKKLTHKSKK